MVKSVCFTREHIEKIRSGFTVDYSILERSIFALALLEALAKVGMPFIFKGGTSLCRYEGGGGFAPLFFCGLNINIVNNNNEKKEKVHDLCDRIVGSYCC